MLVFQLLTTVMVVALLVAEYFASQLGKWIFKPTASLGFLGTAWIAGAWQTGYGRWVLLALALCWLGDILLIPERNNIAFRAGILSFLLGHCAFAVAFVVRGVNHTYGVGALVLLSPVPLQEGFCVYNLQTVS